MDWINTERGFKWSLSANGIAAFVLLILSLNPRLPVAWRRFALIGSGVTLLASKLAVEAANDASIFGERQLEKTFEKVLRALEEEEKSNSLPASAATIGQPVQLAQPVQPKPESHPIAPISTQPILSKPASTPTVAVLPQPQPAPSSHHKIGEELIATLREFKIDADFVGVIAGPTFLRYKIHPRPGVKFSAIAKLDVDLGRKISEFIPCDTPIIGVAGTDVVIDLPRPDRQIVPFEKYISFAPSDAVQPVRIAVGVDLEGKLIEADLSDPNTCHFLTGGITGGGKSNFLESLLASLIWRYSPRIVRLVLVDLKGVAFQQLESCPHLYCPIIRDAALAVKSLENLLQEMKSRYQLFRQYNCKELFEYNQLVKEEEVLPVIVCVFDEYAMLMEDKNFKDRLEESISSLGQQARGGGIHLVIATQRPDGQKVVTPLIRSNLPVRICLKVASEADSKIVLGTDDTRGVNLLGKGDLIYQASGFSERLQSLFVSDWTPIGYGYQKVNSQPDHNETSSLALAQSQSSNWPTGIPLISQWQKVVFPEGLRLLPARSGVYAVVNEVGEVFYIGSAKNILFRWNGKRNFQHHRYPDCHNLLKDGRDVFVAFLPCENYLDVEDSLILAIQPKWNGTPVNKPKIDESKVEKIIALSVKIGWINASKVKSDIWAFRNDTPDTIREYFYELESRSLGSLRNEGESLEWSVEAT